MIIGRGLLGHTLSAIDNSNYLFYVNGISNSVIESIPENNFESSEIRSIARTIGPRTLVYFSTIQANAKENHTRPYVQHKIKMESLIKALFSKYVIVRTSNLIGYNPWNKHTLFNFLYNALRFQTEIQVVESAIRNVLDVEHFGELLNCYLEQFSITTASCNIVNPVSFKMAEILQEFENAFSAKFKRGHAPISIAYFEAPCEFSLALVKHCGIGLENYLPLAIKKYYLPIPKPKLAN